jgi:spore germination protein YaaH/flagellar hook assembly protein FlgD
VSPGSRRSRIRRAGRTIAAIVAILLVGQGQLVSTSTTLSRALGPSPAAPVVPAAAAVRDVHAMRTSEADAPLIATADADVVSFDPWSDDSTGSDTDDAGGLQPSIQFEEAERHASDTIAFTAGGRVTVGFQPRASDRWPVGGGAPTILPAGRLDGRAIRAQGAAATVASPQRLRPPARPAPRLRASATAIESSIDLPSGGLTPVDATTASFELGADPGTAAETVAPEAAISPTGLRREVFGFLPYWEVNSSSLRLDYSKISTIAYFGVGVNANGTLQKRNADGSTSVGWSGWTSTKMTSIISAAHGHHTRVVLTVQSFGWNTSGLTRQKAILGSATHRLTLAKQIAAAVRDRGADGINLDFEPLAATYGAEFTALVRTIRAELNRVHRGYQITFDTTGSVGNYPIADATAAGGADAIFIMGYDYRTAGSSPVGSVAPLARSGYDIRDTILAYRARVPASKLILGVPYYGRAWSTASGALHASNTSSTKTGASTSVVYDTAADYLSRYGHHYDAGEGVAWTAYRRENCSAAYGCVTSWRELYVDDATALGAKYDLVNTYGLRGAGIWALGYDGTRPELYAAIQRKFVADTTPPIAGVKVLPARQMNPGFTVTWTGRDDVAVKSYDVQASTDGGPWAAWLSATTAAAGVWYGMDSHSYAFRVRARDLKGNLGGWNVTSTWAAGGSALKVGGFGVVRVDGLSIRAGADASATKLGTYDSGDLVAIVGGPRSADGYTWYQVVGVLREWGLVTPLGGAGWVAASGAGTTRLSPAKAPNATRIAAALGDLAFGNAGAASLGRAPEAAAHRAFSPNGDRSGDTIAIDWTNDRAFDSLLLRVFRADGTLVGNVPIGKLAAGAHQFDWNGRVGAAALPNGRYLVTLVARDGGTTFFDPSPVFLAGALATYGVTIDTVAPVVGSASSNGNLISPNGDGIRDSVTVKLAATGATRWTFSAAPVSGATVGAAVSTRTGIGGSAAVKWTGRNDAGAVVRDGLYRLTLTALDNAGNRAARAWTVRVDDTPAALAATASPASFSPNGDGVADATRLGWTASERITGSARVYHGTTLIRSWPVSGTSTGAIRWTGTDAAGHAVPDGRYLFRISGRDAAGNPAVLSISVTVDRTLAALKWSRTSFYPQDGDALAPSSKLTFSLKHTAVVTVGIYSGWTLIRAVWTARTLAAGSHGWTWNGRNTAGAMVAPGTYVVRVTAVSSLGTSVLTRAVVVDAFKATLSASSLRAGQTLTITVTSVEPLRAAPVMTFTQPGRTAVKRTAVSLGSGRYRVSFTVASGAAGIATIRIAGRDTAGGLNVSTRSVTIR